MRVPTHVSPRASSPYHQRLRLLTPSSDRAAGGSRFYQLAPPSGECRGCALGVCSHARCVRLQLTQSLPLLVLALPTSLLLTARNPRESQRRLLPSSRMLRAILLVSCRSLKCLVCSFSSPIHFNQFLPLFSPRAVFVGWSVQEFWSGTSSFLQTSFGSNVSVSPPCSWLYLPLGLRLLAQGMHLSLQLTQTGQYLWYVAVLPRNEGGRSPPLPTPHLMPQSPMFAFVDPHVSAAGRSALTLTRRRVTQACFVL